MQVVLYQGAIFYDQFIIGTSDSLTAHLDGSTGEVKSFLVIEIYSFYMIIFGAIVFLFIEIMSSVFNEDKIKEPCRKNRDIIKYSNRTVEW